MGEEYEKVGAEIFPMIEEGSEIKGKLKAVEDGVFGNKVYKIETEEGLRTVFGTVVLDDLMNTIEKEQEIKKVLTGFKENKKKGQNPIKLFEVFKFKNLPTISVESEVWPNVTKGKKTIIRFKARSRIYVINLFFLLFSEPFITLFSSSMSFLNISFSKSLNKLKHQIRLYINSTLLINRITNKILRQN